MDSYPLEIYQGADFELILSAKDDSGSPLDLTGYTIYGALKKRYSDEDEVAVLDCVLSTPISGIVTVSLASQDTADLPVFQGIYDIKARLNDSILVLLQGYASILPGVS